VRTQRDDRVAARRDGDDTVGALPDVIERHDRSPTRDRADDLVHEPSLRPKSHALPHSGLVLSAELGYSRSVDPDLEAKRRTGGAMVTWGILLMVVSFVVTCSVGASRAGRDPYGAGFEAGQQPLFLLGFAAGVALIAVGAAKKANANREQRERIRQASMTTELVPSDKVPGGPFRGALEEVKVPDPVFEAHEAAEREERRQRGNKYLTIGGIIIGLTVIGMVYFMTDKHGSEHQRAERALAALGLSVFPFGIGLWVMIKGALLRSKH
jgi:hypothetical protein